MLLQRPILSLLAAWAIWKILLIAVALASPGVGYDTSTSLLFSPAEQQPSHRILARLATRLTRWDAIYYVHSATRGYVYEQEWAFGTGMAKAISVLAKFVGGRDTSIGTHAVSGIALSNVAHLGSVLCLYKLLQRLAQDQRLAVIGSLLHVITPAGMFMSAPGGEALSSLLSFSGIWLYVESQPSLQLHAQSAQNGLLLTSGALLGLSNTVRSNGVLNGLLFAREAAVLLWRRTDAGQSTAARLQRLSCVGLAGLLVSLGFAAPQYVAFLEYCPTSSARPWCSAVIPSIYSFVQSHYWNVGFLRYWTLSNMPLFMLAAPMLCLMLRSGWAALFASDHTRSRQLFQSIAIPQLLLAILTLTNFHVQIITRISSSYPLVYWYAAKLLQSKSPWSSWIVHWMIVYAIVQGGLYASFLPPA